MKKIIFILSALLSTVYLSGADLTVKITNIKEAKGNIVIGIFDKAEAFPTESKQLKQIVIPVTGETVTKTISSLPNGDYAVAVFHDKNENKACDRNFFGIPKEGFGFSNNFSPKVKAPSFSDVKVGISGNTNMCIKLLHF